MCVAFGHEASDTVGHVKRLGSKVKRRHIAAVVLVAVIVFAVGLAAGWWLSSAYHYPYRTLPRPPVVPGQTAPKQCDGSPTDHSLGKCLPQPKVQNAASITATTQGPDFSNNNPVYSSSAWAEIGAHNAFAIFKVTEGTGYVDPTARPMAAQAKAHGLVVGGYDFLHVCLTNPTSEAQLFVANLKLDGLTGKGTLPGTGDAEYGGTGCDARAWMTAWSTEVHLLSGRWPMIYTGAWWWQPHLGAFWLPHSLAWISGYGVSRPYMPSGRSILDIWQFSDNGFNGYNSSDLSIWRDGAKAFTELTGATAPAPAPAKPKTLAQKLSLSRLDATVRRFGKDKARESNTVLTYVKAHCERPLVKGKRTGRYVRKVCTSSVDHLQKLDGRLLSVHKHGRAWAKPKKPWPSGDRNQVLHHLILGRRKAWVSWAQMVQG